MYSFNDVINYNSSVDIGSVKDILSFLKKESFQLVAKELLPVLKELYGSASKAEKIIREFLELPELPRSKWATQLHEVMTDIINHSLHAEKAFFDCVQFPWVAGIEKLVKDIRVETSLITENIDLVPAFHEVASEETNSTDDLWKVVLFKGYGEEYEKNILMFPVTHALLNMVPDWTTGMYSMMLPGKEIPPHYGPYKGVLRCLLGVDVPGNSGINVKGETRMFEQGKGLIFDDTFLHYAWNRSSRTRVVLFIDFLRPLPFPLNLLNKWVVLSVFNKEPWIQENIQHKKKYQKLQEKLLNEV